MVKGLFSPGMLPLISISSRTTLDTPTGSWRYMRPLYQDRTPPCQDGCPAGEKVQGYLDLAKKRKFNEAWRLIVEDNPLPAVMGRVCYHPCESACNRKDYDEAINIHAVERFLGDSALAQGLELEPASGGERGEHIAVVGSGPAGLSAAYQLARRGYPVTVFEALASPGGVLRAGIPPYRLPRPILDREIGRLQALGVEFRTGIRVGVDLRWEELQRYQAIFLAVGLSRTRPFPVEGARLKGFYSGLEFLRDFNQGHKVRVGARVAVIGGGNVAIDVARTARRLGAEEVSLISLEPKGELPAHPEELEQARREGIRLLDGRGVRRIQGRNSWVEALEVARVDFQGRDPVTGAVAFTFRKGKGMLIPVETVIAAIGQEADLSFLPQEIRGGGWLLPVDDHGRLRDTNIFAGGDVVTGPARAVDAIGAGKRAALAIHSYLQGVLLEEAKLPPVVPYERLNLAYFIPAKRAESRSLPIRERLAGFTEVESGLSQGMVRLEAERCMSCGVCNGCDNCWLFCPDLAISRKARERGAYVINYDYCKGCGICVEECPRTAMALEEEVQWRR
ncbi:MAG: FAD-dependent oxidoreductase [candidate division NC10 bacterium]|nr:FAD-dependent oxidoreductase [candidate division NC10 bacterium]